MSRRAERHCPKLTLHPDFNPCALVTKPVLVELPWINKMTVLRSNFPNLRETSCFCLFLSWWQAAHFILVQRWYQAQLLQPLLPQLHFQGLHVATCNPFPSTTPS